MAEIKELLDLLAEHGGKIISTGNMDLFSIQQAQASDRIYVDENSMGYVWLPSFDFPETEEQVEQFERWYPLPCEMIEEDSDRILNNLLKEINKQID